MSRCELEVCVDTLRACIIAEQAGATRIELNTALSEDGLTPSLGVLRCAKEQVDLPVFCMARPHNRGFVYSGGDKRSILLDCEALIAAGADGVVVGALADKNPADLDWEFLEDVARRFPDSPRVIHRAFDHVADKASAAKRLASLGFCRILTSGDQPSVPDSLQSLRELQESAGDVIEILPGGGVNSRCADAILRSTGVWQLHGSFRGGDGLPDAREIQAVKESLARHANPSSATEGSHRRHGG